MVNGRAATGPRAARAWQLLALFGLATFGFGCSKPGPQVGGESHWLAECNVDRDCGSGGDLSCVCGTCTRACSNDNACAGDVEAACYDPNSPVLLQRCGDRSAHDASGICLARCKNDSACDTHQSCVQGACVAAASTAAPLPSDFNGKDASVSWSTPVKEPMPSLVIASADARLLGTWLEVGCDPDTVFGGEEGIGCQHLTVERQPSGEITGSVQFDRTPRGARNYPIVIGPFAPVTDPDVGYPTEITPEQYGLASGGCAGFPYRILDGRFQGDHLSFDWSPFDVWQTWCAQQTPYRWTAPNHDYYFCVPENTETLASLDLGKVTLCTPEANTGGLPCQAGENGPSCVICGADTTGVRCGPAYCHCESDGCVAELHVSQQSEEFVLNGDQLTLVRPDGPNAPPVQDALVLARVKP